MSDTLRTSHMPALAAAAAGLEQTAAEFASASGAGADAFDDEEYPFAPGALNGIKCCTKCGATKTPQWREGPFGPKTLCNACGVKRTRKLRAEQEGAKRRKLSTSPVPSPAKHTYAATAPASKYKNLPAHYSQEAPLAGIDSYGSLEPECDAWGLPATGAAAGAAASARRPPRRAAEEAAFKTARYARTGEWAEEQEGALHDAMHAATPSSSSGYSLPSSNCPEEVSWPPAPCDNAAAAAGSDCFAAINLMTMSAKQTAHVLAAATAAAAAAVVTGAGSSGAAPSGAAAPSVAAAAAATTAATTLPSSAAATAAGASGPAAATATAALPPGLDAEQINHDCLAALVTKYDGCGAGAGAGLHMRPHRVVPVELAELSQCLPPNKVLELVRLNQELEMAVHEAHAANAAVAAVAQVLAAKQAAALRLREVAGNATKRLRRFMSELDVQFGIQSKFGAAAAAVSAGRRPLLSPPKLPQLGAAGVVPPSLLAAPAPLSPAAPALPPVLPPRLPAAPALNATCCPL